MKIVNYILVTILTLAGVTFDACVQPEPSYFLSMDEKKPGAEGPYEMIHESFQNPLWKNNPVHVFHPQGFVGESPVVFLSNKDGSKEPEKYLSLIRHIVSKGYVVVFSPTRRVLFKNSEIHKYKLLFEAYTAAVSRFATIIDTTRIGFIGHGFGGGAVPALMLRAIRKSRWGASGAFMYIVSPGYMYSMDQRSLDTYPEIVKLVVQIFTDDKINDPKIAADIYSSIAVPNSDKVFLVVTSDTIGKRQVHANENTPKTVDIAGPVDNPLVYYGNFRIFDDLAAYTFKNDTNAKSRIFPQKKSITFTMSAWDNDVPIRPMIATHDPELFMKEGPYLNSWHGLRNPRVEISVFKKTQILMQVYYHNAWRQYMRFLGKIIKRFFNENELPDTLENPIKKGYGAPGIFETIADSFANPADRSLNVYIYRPQHEVAPIPAIFFMNGYLGQAPQQSQPLIRQFVSNGYIVIYPTYAFFPRINNTKNIIDKYNKINAGINRAIELYITNIDTTRIGFFGQSFGASMIPSVAYRMLIEKNWGKSGAFMFLIAPWYVYEFPQKNLRQFPSHVNLVIQVYNDDRINDHEIAVDLFNTIGIPSSRKKYYTVFSDSSNGVVMNANHFTAYGIGNINGEQNFLDYYGIYKLFDALADYSFTGNTMGREMSLDAGTEEQLYMGTWSTGRVVFPMEVTINPKAYNPESQYMYTFNNPLNPHVNLNNR